MIVVPRRFRVVRSLGEGGMGIVYEAFDEQRKGLVALKALRNVSPESIARFKREFRALADVQHPNLVSLGELIFDDGQWFLTMELVEGTDFLSYVRRVGDSRGALRIVGRTPTPVSPTEQNLALAANESVAVVREVVATDAELVGFDEARLRSSLRQLALALSALHRAGLVHRDIKPSNIRVTPSGRVVVLDFGLVANLRSSRDSSDPKIVGTPAYMAPEQAANADVGAAADWYGVGVMLYEAMTGELPFEGGPVQVLIAKQQREAGAASAVAPNVPPDLDALCSELLRFEPSARPNGDRVLATLNARAEAPSVAALTSGTQSAPFVGRADELGEIHAAYRKSRAGAPVTLFVEGESGVGKTCLVRRFTDELTESDSSVVVLHGRCYERETVPYKALDGVVDSLARALARMPREGVARVLPTRPGPLVQVFPVLRRVEAIATLSLPSSSAMDPLEVRGRAFAALRELLARLGELRGVVVTIDDVQWADADSHALLAEILRPPEAPRLLLVATLRTFFASTSTSMSSIQLTDSQRPAAGMPGEVRTLTLTKLPSSEARELAARLLERAVGPDDEGLAASIAFEADGHPLFIDALVRHASIANATQGATRPRLDDALWASIERLDERSRELMEILAVAGAPIPQNVLLMSAMGIDRADLVKAVSSLRAAHLVSTAGTRETDRIEPYHDRLRLTILARLDDARRIRHHQRIALAFETTGTHDAQMLATHWRGARDVERAARYAVLAGDEATRALAFDRAAKLYRRALRLRPLPSHEKRVLLTKLAFAFANAGRGARAAAAFQDAARGAKEADALDLRRRAADQLLRSGHIDEGVAAIGRVLASVGMKLPSTLWVAIIAFVVGRLTIAMRGLKFVERDSSQIAPRDLTLVDICSSAAAGLSLADNIRGSAFQANNLLLALRAGEPYRIARALAFEVAFLARGGGATWRRTQRTIAAAQSLAKKCGNPHAIALSVGTAGVAHYLVGRFQEGLAMCDAAQAKFRDECADATWEIDSMQLFALGCLLYMGELKELARRHALYLRETRDRGDRYAEVNLRVGHASIVWLILDDPARSRKNTAEAMAAWSKGGFHIEHWYGLFSAAQEALYSGDGARAHAELTARWPALRRSMLRTIQMVRVQSSHLRGRVALAAAAVAGGDRRALARRASRDARAIERERMPWASPLAKLLRAGAMVVASDEPASRVRAAAIVRTAIAELDAMKMALYAAAARLALGQLVGGDEGGALVAEAEAWMRGEGVARPDKLARMLVPGFGAETARPTRRADGARRRGR